MVQIEYIYEYKIKNVYRDNILNFINVILCFNYLLFGDLGSEQKWTWILFFYMFIRQLFFSFIRIRLSTIFYHIF